MTAPSRATLLHSSQLMLSQSPVGKPVSVRLRFDFPCALKCFSAISGRLLFSASAAEFADVLKEN